MKTTINNKTQLFTLLSQGSCVITPNNRLSSAYLEDYFDYVAQDTLDKPKCLPYKSMLTQAYQNLLFLNPNHTYPLLLNTAQCQHLWYTLIHAENRIYPTLGLLQSLIQAWEHCKQWEVSPNESAFAISAQTKLFQTLWQQLEEKLNLLHAISEYDIVSYLCQEQNTLHVSFAHTVIWACFDEFTPQQRRLQTALHEQGITQYQYDLANKQGDTRIFAANDQEEEYQQLIAWLKKQQHRQIGIVVPNLKQEAKQIKRRLASYFDEQHCNISLGQRLNDYPLISHALTWLKLNPQEPLQLADITLLLQSPYLGEAKEEFLKRSQYLQESPLLRHQTLDYRIFVDDLSVLLPALAKRINSLQPYPEAASIQEWINLYQNRLNGLGFPGDYSLNSENYQCFQRFLAVFDEFRQLCMISPILQREEAFAAFETLIQNTLFQAQQKSRAPIQILGLLEASGCEFDGLWIMGLTHQFLPQKTQLSAFIPAKLQQQLMMPHSLPERELQLAKKTLHRLQHSSVVTVLSYPKLKEDLPQMPSPLLLDFPAYLPLAISNQPEACMMYSYDECYQIPLDPDEHLSGGTRLLANQAKCPFKAFAEHRLFAKPIENTVEGIDAPLKGQISHHLLELLWRQLKTQDNLLKQSPESLAKLIDKALKTALFRLKPMYGSLIYEVEYTRLERLLNDYLEWEKTRPSFEVEALEASYTIELNQLRFKVRLDRLDRVDGEKWVIDYKTTLPNKPWQEERPQEPQLLVYALLDESISTLLFLQLKSGKIKASGVTASDEAPTGIETIAQWTSMQKHWNNQLTALAQEIHEGICLPQPIQESLCQQCEFQRLCRRVVSS